MNKSIKPKKVTEEVALCENDVEDILLRLIEVLTIAYEKNDKSTQKQITNLIKKYCLDYLGQKTESQADIMCVFILKILGSKPEVIKEFFKNIEDDN